MSTSFTIDVDVARSFVRVTARGFFQPGDVTNFRDALRREYRALRCLPNEHVTFLDIRDMAIQPQEVVPLFSQVMTDPQIRSKKVAVVVAKSLNRLQMRRAAAVRDAVALFGTEQEALDWLAVP